MNGEIELIDPAITEMWVSEWKKEGNKSLHCDLDDNEIDLPDGFYRVVMEYFDINEEMVDWFSETLVPVRSGLISIKELFLATRECLELNGYWGSYLESVEYCEDTNCLRIEVGS